MKSYKLFYRFNFTKCYWFKKKTWIIDAYQPPNKLNWTELNTLSLELSCHYTYNVLFDYRGGRRGFHRHVKLQPKIHSYTTPAPK